MNIKSSFQVTHKDGYSALVTEREFEGATIFALFIENEFFANIQNLLLVKRNGEWLKHDSNLSDPLFTFWGGLIGKSTQIDPLIPA